MTAIGPVGHLPGTSDPTRATFLLQGQTLPAMHTTSTLATRPLDTPHTPLSTYYARPFDTPQHAPQYSPNSPTRHSTHAPQHSPHTPIRHIRSSVFTKQSHSTLTEAHLFDMHNTFARHAPNAFMQHHYFFDTKHTPPHSRQRLRENIRPLDTRVLDTTTRVHVMPHTPTRHSLTVQYTYLVDIYLCSTCCAGRPLAVH